MPFSLVLVATNVGADRESVKRRRAGRQEGDMGARYHHGNRELQDQFDTRRLADRLAEVKVHHIISPDDREFIERCDMFFLATADAQGRPTCSYKGGDPGFVRVVDQRTIAFPNYDGNGMYLSWGNVMVNPEVGLLFIDFERQRRLRLDGRASVDPTDPLRSGYPEAQFVVRVEAREIFPNCPRYIHRYQLVERSRFVPRAGCATPSPDWKRSPWARDVLPAGDPAGGVQGLSGR
jgi:predicted pyridoxine 5'-phosphate oxidase superfamily flavin-nucleotide-binding protein